MTTVEDLQRVMAERTAEFPETVVCAVCGEARPRHLVMLTGHPIGQCWDLDPLEITRNVWHCSDRADCLARGEDPEEWTRDLAMDWGDDLDREIRLKTEG